MTTYSRIRYTRNAGKLCTRRLRSGRLCHRRARFDIEGCPTCLHHAR